MKCIKLSNVILFGTALLVTLSCTKSNVDTQTATVKQVGVFSESHSAVSGDAQLSVIGSSVVITTNTTNLSEGYEGLQVQVGVSGWIRFEFSPVSAVSLSDYAAGYLNFSIKTTSTKGYFVGIKSSGGSEYWVPLTSSNYTADGKWYAVSIPVNSFVGADFSAITTYFMISNSNATTAGDIIYLDDIYWTDTAVQSKLWNMVWSDEFSGPSIDTGNWGYDTGSGGWGNNELQNYTTTNAVISNSNLVIWCYYLGGDANGSGNYTSSRLLTKGKQSWLYGRFAARMKLDVVGQGGWPAFWLLGTNIDSAGWPLCGEIDIMECGKSGIFNAIGGTLHWGTNWSTDHRYLGADYYLSSGTFADGYHIFEVEWNSSNLTWKVDGFEFYSLNVPTLAIYNAIFQKHFFIILNLAVGGSGTSYTGNQIPDTSKFPKRAYVDWVRVYQLQP